MDYKPTYTKGVEERKVQSQADSSLAKVIERGAERRRKYGENWQEVDIDEIVNIFAPGSSPSYRSGKIYFFNKEGTIAVVADVGGGYLRIQDLTSHARYGNYLDINGHDAHNVVDEDGKIHGRSRDEYNAVTHFLIKKRKESKEE